MFFDKYTELCKRKGKTPTGVAIELNVSRATVNYWKNGNVPKQDTLIKIANYFGVSVDYLLGNATMEKHPAKIGEVPEILKKYYILNEDDRRTVEIMIDSFLQKDCYKQKENVG